MFTYKIDSIIYNGVANIGRKGIITKGVRTVRWSHNEDEWQLYTNKLNNVLKFPDPLVRIPSAIILHESIKDDEGTWVLTKTKYYILTWDFGKYQKENISLRKLVY